MKKNRHIIILSIVALFPGIISGQTIMGVIVNGTTRLPMEFVNVQIRKIADSTLVTGTVSHKNGRFEVNNVPDGEYTVHLSYVGYEVKKITPVIVTHVNPEVDMGTISLVETPVTLEEVMVTSEMELLNPAIDRKVYNVDQDIMSKSLSASDVLRNIPSVEVDIDGEVSLRGSSNVLIMIDGKTSPLMGKNKAEALQQIPATMVQRIEIMTNPSAKYRPDATAGMINLVLKRSSGAGLNGGFNLNAGNNDRYNGNVRLNYDQGDISIFGSYGPRKDRRNHTDTDLQTQVDASSNTRYYNQNTISSSNRMSHLLLLGGDFKIDKNNRAGLTGNYFYKGSTTVESANTIHQDDVGATAKDYERRRYEDAFEPSVDIKSFYQHNSQGGNELRIELKASQSRDQEVGKYTTLNRFPTSTTLFDNTDLTVGRKEKEASFDYSNPLSEHSKFEAGYTGELNGDDIDFYAEDFDTVQQGFVKNLEKTNRFLHDETIHALYATYEQRLGSFGFKAGIRAEKVFVKSYLVSNNIGFSSEYSNLYPTLHVSYKLSETAEAQLNYSRRTYRPQVYDLNPFPEYNDPRNLFAGNPYLKPEYIHSIEFGCQFESDRLSFLPAIYYQYKYNRFTSVTRMLNDSTLLRTLENLSSGQSAGAEFVLSGTVIDGVSTNASANIFYDEIDASNLGFAGSQSTVTWKGALTCNVSLSSSTRFQVYSKYSAAKLSAQGKTGPSYTVNLGFRQNLWDDRVSVVFTASDLFGTRKKETELLTPTLSQRAIALRDSRVLYLGFTFRFGATKKSKEESQMQYDEE